MKLPCRLRAVTYARYGVLELHKGECFDAQLSAKQSSNSRYRNVTIVSQSDPARSQVFTEAALENAVKRGDFEVV